MLSWGKWHESVPTDPRENLKFRRWLLRNTKTDQDRQAIRDVCKRDILFFLRCMAWQYNPLLKGEDNVGPFIPWHFQEQALLMEPPVGKGILWCYEHDKTAVVEKSRDMGASWLFLFFQAWIAIFHNNTQCLNISRSLEAVDDKSRDSLFSKLRFINKHLPDWLVGPLDDTKCTILYQKSESEISGEASTGKAGVGGRATVVFVDEFSKIKEDAQVRQSTASTAECRFFNGTHEGVGTEFFRLTEAARNTGEIVLIQMHWTRHPRKNQHLYSWDVAKGKPQFYRFDPVWDEIVPQDHPAPGFPEDYPYDRSGHPAGGPHPGIRSTWYDKKAVEIGNSRQVAMELDINPTGSASQFYDGLTIRSLITKSKDSLWVGDIDFDRETVQPYQLVPLAEGSLQLWLEPGLDSNGRLCHVPPSSYILGGDIGTGTGASPTCFSIFDGVRGTKVGRWLNRWKSELEAAHVAVALCRLFKDIKGESAFLAWETPGPGNAFGQVVLKDIGFRNIYWRTEPFGDEERQSDKPGWHAGAASRRQLHTEYRTALTVGDFVNPDREALEETMGYVYGATGQDVEHPKAKKNPDAAAAGQNHGDLVVADALCWLMAKKRHLGRLKEEKAPETFAVPNSIQGRREYNRLRERASAGSWL